jgi:hypothetical protein
MMTEPASTTTGIVVGAGIGLTGTILGAQIDALLMGMIAAVFASIWMPSIDNRIRAASAVAIATLLAGYGSPVLAHWLAATQPGLEEHGALRMLLAVLIGGGCPALLPVAMERVQKIITGAQS